MHLLLPIRSHENITFGVQILDVLTSSSGASQAQGTSQLRLRHAHRRGVGPHRVRVSGLQKYSLGVENPQKLEMLTILMNELPARWSSYAAAEDLSPDHPVGHRARKVSDTYVNSPLRSSHNYQRAQSVSSIKVRLNTAVGETAPRDTGFVFISFEGVGSREGLQQLASVAVPDSRAPTLPLPRIVAWLVLWWYWINFWCLRK